MMTVYLKEHEGRGISAGGCWIYDNEIARIEDFTQPGDLVRVIAANGYALGTGYYNPASKIAIRMLTRDPDTEIDRDFFRMRIENAISYRESVTGLENCRLIFGEADRLPGLTVDKFADILVTQTLALGIERRKDEIFECLLAVLKEHGQNIRGIYERNDARSRALEGLERGQGFWRDRFDPCVRICENDLFYDIDVSNGQKTGYFLDQRFNRMAIRPLAKNAKVLDCFCNAGGFALNALAAGAHSALGVDASEQAVACATANAAANGFSSRASFLCEDVFALLPQLVQRAEQFDLVILDPPAFAKSRASIKTAMRGYREINRRGMQLVRDGGFFATCTCSHFITAQIFEETIALAARDAHVRLRLIERRAQAPDHPVLMGANESEYLKFLTFQIQKER